MKQKLIGTLILIGTVMLGAGCYTTLQGNVKYGAPWGNDTIVSRYVRPVNEIYAAAKQVLSFNGTLVGENTLAHTLVARIDTRTVWVKVDQVDTHVSQVETQARTKNGAPAIQLASEVDKQIALRLR